MAEDIEQLLEKIDKVLIRKGISRVAFGEGLNHFLPKRLRRPVTRSRAVTIYRWFSKEQNHRKPNADTAMAMKDWYLANNT